MSIARALLALAVVAVPACASDSVVTMAPPEPGGGVLRLTVGPGQQVARVGDGVVACWVAKCTDLFLTVHAVPGDPAYYEDDAAKAGMNPVTGRGWVNQLSMNVTIEGVPAKAAGGTLVQPRFTISGAAALYYRKAIFIPFRDFTMRGIDCDGGKEGRFYQLACVRPEPTDGRAQNIVLERNEFHNWANGNLGTMTGGTWVGRRNYYHDTGAGDGLTHGLYVATVDTILSDHELSVRTDRGHLYKTRAKRTTITGGRFFDLDTGNSSYGIDVPEGGVTAISDTVIQRGPKAENGPAIAIGEEVITGACPKPQCIAAPDGRAHSITLSNVTILSQTPADTPFKGTLGLWNRLGVPVTAVGTKVFGPARAGMMNNGTADVPMPGGVTVLPAMPVLDLASPVWGP